MKKHGYTLVEIAVVLILIGILAGIGLRTVALISTAKLKKELNSLAKLESGLMAYVANTGSLPDYDDDDAYILDTEPLRSQHYIMEEDLISSAKRGARWVYRQCELSGDDFTLLDDTTVPYNDTGSLICLSQYPEGLANIEMDSSLICIIEEQYDDMHLGRSKGRSTNASDNLSEDDYADCKRVTGTMDYLYRVF